MSSRIDGALRAFRADRLEDARTQAQAAATDPSPALAADAATLLARIARRMGQLDVALAESSRAIAAAQAAADPARECVARVQRAHALNALGRTEVASQECDQARRLANDSGDAAAEAAALEGLAVVQWSMSRWHDARASFQQMLDMATAAGDLEQQAIAHGGLSSVEGEIAGLADAAAAPAHRQRAWHHVGEYLRLATALGDVHAMRSARHNQAVALLALGQREEARRTLEAVHAESTGGASHAVALLNLAELDLEEGQPAEAVRRLEAARALLTPTGDAGYLQACCLLLCNACEAMGDTAAALDWHRQYHAHYARQASERAQMHARALEVKYDTGRAHAQADYERLRAEQYERASLEDGLTGIGNRRAFDAALAGAQGRLATGQPFALALLDVDNFKRINDAHSHQVGDEVLRRIGWVLASNCRQQDTAARYGGEEFALVLPDVDGKVAGDICERIRQAVEHEAWDDVSPGLSVTVSFGCVSRHAGDGLGDVSALLAAVDQRLYVAKASGRNRTVCS